MSEFPCRKSYCCGMPGFLTYMELMIDDHTVCISISLFFLLTGKQLRLIVQEFRTEWNLVVVVSELHG